MIIATLTTANRIELVGAGGLILWLVLAATTASYGASKGFSFGALFICTFFLGFPLVLLGITIGSGIRHDAR